VFVQYWSMRVMAYLAGAVALFGLWGALLLWRRRLDSSRVFLWCATWGVLAPFAMGTAGWVLTENGRQPWIVEGLMLTRDGLSTSVSAAEVAVSLAVFVLLYAIVGITALVLMLRHVRGGPEPESTAYHQRTETDSDDRAPALTY